MQISRHLGEETARLVQAEQEKLAKKHAE